MERTDNQSAFSFYAAEYWGYFKSGVRRFFTSDRQLWMSFLAPFMILLISYFVFGVFPFGKESVLSLDLNGQYVYYYDHMYDVFAGKESVFYSWNRNLSGEFMGIIGYYLASPFNLLVWIWPRECITEGLLTMMVTKVGSIGLCTAVYLSKGKGMNRLTTVIFSTCYALCAYTLEQTMNPMWLDGVMILPVVIYGIEKLMDEGKFIMLTISLTYAFVTCFYIGYMIGIFAAIYFLYYACVSHKKGLHRLFIKRGLMFTGVAVVSVMMSAFMLLPVYHSLSYGKFDFSTGIKGETALTANFNFVEMLDKMFPGTYDTCRMSGLPFIYCGTIVLIMLPCWFFSKKVRGRDRIGMAALMSLMCVCMYIKQVDMLWHGGQLPNWLPYRYSFMLTFLMVTCAAQAFNDIAEIPKKRMAIAALGWFVVLLLIENTDKYLEDIKRDTMDGITVILPAMLVLFIVAAALVQLRDRLNKKGWVVLLCCIIFAESLYNTISQIFRQDADIVYSTRASYNDVIQPTRKVVNKIKADDPGFYRMEKTYHRTVNDPMALDMYGLSHSSSTLNSKPIELLQKLGFSARSHYTRYTGATEVTKSLFGVKYELSCPDNSTDKLKKPEDITVTRNELALPMAYLVDNDYMDLTLPLTEPFKSQNQLLAAMLGRDETSDCFTRIINSPETPVDLVKTNVTQGKTKDGHHMFKVVKKGENAELVYTLHMPVKSSLYMYLPSKFERKVNVWLNREKFLGTYFEGDNNSIMKIGDFEEGEQVIIGLTLTRDDLYFREAQFVYINEENIKADLTELIQRNSQTVAERPTPTTMKVTVTADSDKTLFTSIPVEKGWEVFIDGEKAEFDALDGDIRKNNDDDTEDNKGDPKGFAYGGGLVDGEVELSPGGTLPGANEPKEPQKVNYHTALGALIAVPVTAGTHVIEFKFTTAGYPLAIWVSLAGLALFIFAAVLYERSVRPKNQPAPKIVPTTYEDENAEKSDDDDEDDIISEIFEK